MLLAVALPDELVRDTVALRLMCWLGPIGGLHRKLPIVLIVDG
jgi:hypothetical protein